MWPRSENLKPIWEDWHETRHAARVSTFNVEEWSDIEITKYDLDTADITGEDNPRSYEIDNQSAEIDGVQNNGEDIRTLDRR
jgi:hypothetical protein